MAYPTTEVAVPLVGEAYTHLIVLLAESSSRQQNGYKEDKSGFKQREADHLQSLVLVGKTCIYS